MNRTFLGMLGVSVVAVVALAMSGSASASTPTNGRIAFYRADVAADSSSCFTIDPDGTDEHQVAPGTSMFCGTWSPDSSKLLESPFPNGFARPATSNPDGSGYTVLDAYPNLQQNIGCGFWSPDGARFLCSSDDGLYTVRSSDGGDLQRVTHSPTLDVFW